MRAGEVAVEKYVINKSLTKNPEDYPDAKSQPHVQVSSIISKYKGKVIPVFSGRTSRCP